MTQAATVNASLAAAVPVLQSALAAKNFDTYTVFQVLRSVSGDAITGQALATHVVRLVGRRATSGPSCRPFYTVVRQTAGEGLDASIRNKAAYKAAAAQMVQAAGRRRRAGRAAPDGRGRRWA